MTKTWKTKEGEEIPVSKMTERHITNTVNLLKRRIDDMGSYIGYDHENNSFDIGLEIQAEKVIKLSEDWIKVFNNELGRR